MKFILFDCDGVLVDTEAVAAKVVTEWLGTCNCIISEDEFIKEHTGKTFGTIFKQLVDDGSIAREHWKDDVIEKLEESIYQQIVVVSGIPECLQRLKNYEKAVISNSRTIMVRKALKATGLDNFLDPSRIISSELVERPKPDPGVYLLALQKFHQRANDCVAIEDSLSGVKAAVGAGIRTIGFAGASHLQQGHDKLLLKAGASSIAYHAREIPDLILK